MGKALVVFAGFPRVEPVYKDWFYERVIYPNLKEWTFDIVIHTQINRKSENTFIKRDFKFPTGLIEKLTGWYDNKLTRLKEITVSTKDRTFHLSGQRYLQAIERATVDEDYDQVLACRFETLFTRNFTIGQPKVFTHFHAIHPEKACDLDYAFMGDPFSMISYFKGRVAKAKEVKKHLTNKWEYRFKKCERAESNFKSQSGRYQYLINHGYKIDLQEAMLARHLGPGWVTLETMRQYKEWPERFRKHIPKKFL